MRAGREGRGRKSGRWEEGRTTALHGSVAVRHGRGELFASKPPRRPDRMGPVACSHGNGSMKSRRKGSSQTRGSFEYGLSSKEPVVSQGAPRLSVKQRREVVAQLERTGQGCSITRIGAY